MRRLEGYMHGVNLGGWVSQFDDTTKEYYDTFIVEKDIQRIAKAGFDHVRIPVDYVMLETEDGTPIETGYSYLDKAVKWCKDAGIRIVLDLHGTFGYTFDPLVDDDKEIFFRDKDLQKRFFDLWDRISKRYGEYSDMLAFEPLNEVISMNVVDEWNEISTECARVIRKNAPNSYVIIGGVCYNSVVTVPLLSAPLDDKIVFNFHCYEPMIFTHQRAFWVKNMPDDIVVEYPEPYDVYKEKTNAIDPELAAAMNSGIVAEIGPDYFEALFKPALEAAEKYNVPLYCGEYGVIELAPVDSAKRWFDDIHSVFDKYGIGRAIWNYKKKDFGDTFEHVFMEGK